MKSPHYLTAFCLLLQPCAATAADGVVDLSKLHEYASQTVPTYITRNNTPGNNAITNSGATLGRILFYDKRLSRNNTISCSSCHLQSRAFSDTATASTGVAGTTGRHAMRLINARFSAESKFFWNERAASLEIQTTQPIQDHVEMGFSGTSGDPALADLVTKLSAISEYRVLFTMTFGSSTINETLIQRALAQFVRSIQSFDSKYDAGRATANDNQPFPNFTASENAGKALFLNPPGPGPAPGGGGGGAGCAGCHRPPEFDIDPASLNNGIIASLAGGTDLTNTRSPSLRDLVGPGGQSNGAFMHDGSKATLATVVAHYNAIPGDNANLDPRLRRPGGVQNLNLTAQQQSDLVAFLRTLTGSAVYTDEKWSSPFSATGALELIVLPSTSMAMTRLANGSPQITSKAAPNLAYQFQTSDDLVNWTTIATVNSGAQGMLTQTVNMAAAKKFFRFTYTPPAS